MDQSSRGSEVGMDLDECATGRGRAMTQPASQSIMSITPQVPAWKHLRPKAVAGKSPEQGTPEGR